MSRFSSAPGAPSFDSEARQAHGQQPALDAVFPLLLAIADDDRAAAAIRITRELARTHGAIPTALRALGHSHEADALVQSFAGYVAEDELSPEYHDAARAQLQRQITEFAGDTRWGLATTDEPPLDAIVHLARQTRAGLIVMGLRRHGVMHRAMSGDLLGSVVHLASVPVLAIEPSLETLPRRVVVAVDFGASSVRAARIARHILAEDGEMHLVHVSSDTIRNRMSAAVIPDSRGPAGKLRELEQMIEDLQPEPAMKMAAHVMEGDRAAAIDGYAERVRADLLAVGSDEHPLLDRLVTPSVSMGLARLTHRSVLIVPQVNPGIVRRREATATRYSPSRKENP